LAADSVDAKVDERVDAKGLTEAVLMAFETVDLMVEYLELCLVVLSVFLMVEQSDHRVVDLMAVPKGAS